jgi:hypothetical protein
MGTRLGPSEHGTRLGGGSREDIPLPETETAQEPKPLRRFPS